MSVACIRPLSGYLFTYTAGLGLFGAWLGLVLDQFMRLFLTTLRVRSGKWLNIRI